MSSQPLSLREEDYETIEAAVMETARGRWFLSEYARRNRAADTAQVLDAIAALEKKLETAPTPDQAAIAGDDQTKRQILAAAEDVQEASWALRELGANPDFCERLDRNAVDISAACASPSINPEELSDAEVFEEDIIDEENGMLFPAVTLIENAVLPKSSLPQIQAKLATEWPDEEKEALPAESYSNPSGFNLAAYCFEEKIALFS